MKSFVRNISYYWEINQYPSDADIKAHGTPKNAKRLVLSDEGDRQLALATPSALSSDDFASSNLAPLFVVKNIMETPFQASLRLKNYTKLPEALQRKVQSIDVKVSLYESSTATLTLSGLTVSQAESQHLLLGTILEIKFGSYDWFAIKASSTTVFRGKIKERTVTYGEDGISMTLQLISVQGLILKVPFRYNLFHSGDNVITLEKALEKIADYIGAPIFLGMPKEEQDLYNISMSYADFTTKAAQKKALQLQYEWEERYRLSIEGYASSFEVGDRPAWPPDVPKPIQFPLLSQDQRSYVWRDYFYSGIDKKAVKTAGAQSPVFTGKTPQGLLEAIANHYKLRMYEQGNAIFLVPIVPNRVVMKTDIKKFFSYRHYMDSRIPFLNNIQPVNPTDDAEGDLFEKFEVVENMGQTGTSQAVVVDPWTGKAKTTSEKQKIYSTIVHRKGAFVSAIAADDPEIKKIALAYQKTAEEKFFEHVTQVPVYGEQVVSNTGALEDPKKAIGPHASQFGRGVKHALYSRITGVPGDVNLFMYDRFSFTGCKEHTGLYYVIGIEYHFTNSNSFTMNLIGERDLEIQANVERIQVEIAKAKKMSKIPEVPIGKQTEFVVTMSSSDASKIGIPEKNQDKYGMYHVKYVEGGISVIRPLKKTPFYTNPTLPGVNDGADPVMAMQKPELYRTQKERKLVQERLDREKQRIDLIINAKNNGKLRPEDGI